MQKSELYERLSILDNKCAALLDLSSLVLAISVISASLSKDAGLPPELSIGEGVIAVLFLTTSLLSLVVIWVKWDPTETTLKYRTIMYKTAVILTGIGLIFMAILVFITLYS